MEEPSEEDFFTNNLKQITKNDDNIYNQRISKLNLLQGNLLCSIETNTITHLPNMSQPSFYRIHWNQQNDQTYFKGFMVTTNVKFVKKLIRICDMCAQTKDHAIGHMVYYNLYSQFLKVHDHLFLSTSS
jgi:hypothetical protein